LFNVVHKNSLGLIQAITIDHLEVTIQKCRLI
jgi:hypothetical protein